MENLINRVFSAQVTENIVVADETKSKLLSLLKGDAINLLLAKNAAGEDVFALLESDGRGGREFLIRKEYLFKVNEVDKLGIAVDGIESIIGERKTVEGEGEQDEEQ